MPESMPLNCVTLFSYKPKSLLYMQLLEKGDYLSVQKTLRPKVCHKIYQIYRRKKFNEYFKLSEQYKNFAALITIVYKRKIFQIRLFVTNNL